jgi:hypothetical protein
MNAPYSVIKPISVILAFMLLLPACKDQGHPTAQNNLDTLKTH